MNFKIRVVENIGSKSCELFGCPGTILEVKDGILQDNDGFEWENDSKLFHNLEEINMYFMVEDLYQTRFEMAEGRQADCPLKPVEKGGDEMLTEKQLQALIDCEEKEDCTGETCPIFEICDNDYTNKVAAEAAQTALAYREMLERARKTLQDAWDDDGGTVIGNQILETINAIDALLGKEQNHD